MYRSYFPILLDGIVSEIFDEPAVFKHIRISREDTGAVSYALDIPGIPKDRLRVRVEQNAVTIEGERDGKKTRRTFSIADGLDESTGKARLEDGVLTLRFEPLADKSPKLLEIV